MVHLDTIRFYWILQCLAEKTKNGFLDIRDEAFQKESEWNKDSRVLFDSEKEVILGEKYSFYGFCGYGIVRSISENGEVSYYDNEYLRLPEGSFAGIEEYEDDSFCIRIILPEDIDIIVEMGEWRMLTD